MRIQVLHLTEAKCYLAASANLGQPLLHHDAGLFNGQPPYWPKAGLRRPRPCGTEA
jgi:hypothetical protein